ncbi:MAG: glycerol dehydrogenase [Pseudomonadales bacterium]|nr:glycerol dehydrogenase [Pseudomonadales bacterium]
MDTFSAKKLYGGGDHMPPLVMAAPQRYIQGPGAISRIGRYIGIINVKRAAILASRRAIVAEGARVTESLHSNHIESVDCIFDGECSLPEIEKHVAALKDENIDCLIAVGGGKPVDAGKSIAWRLDIPVVIVPTLASNDAPCSALSVLYTPEGASDVVEFYPTSPTLVVIDTDIVADANERYLVAGMGDAMATWYEARICLNNLDARTPLGARPTIAACAMAEICAHTLFEHGEAAAKSVVANQNGTALEKVVEANTLLSGIGFESGGLALAHPMALAYTQIDELHTNYLHGEMVAMGTMVQLAMEQSEDAKKVAQFFARVGLPIHLGQFSMSPQDTNKLDIIIESAMANANSHQMPMVVTEDLLLRAIMDAHELGLRIAEEIGDEAYQRLRA